MFLGSGGRIVKKKDPGTKRNKGSGEREKYKSNIKKTGEDNNNKGGKERRWFNAEGIANEKSGGKGGRLDR